MRPMPVWLHVEEAATGARHSPDADRFLGTMLFTDVVGSTELLARIGDAEYRALRATHERHVRLEVEQGGGRLVSVTGDGNVLQPVRWSRATRFAVLTRFARRPRSASRCAPAFTPGSSNAPDATSPG